MKKKVSMFLALPAKVSLRNHHSWSRGNPKTVVLTGMKFTCNSLLDDNSVSQSLLKVLFLPQEICGNPSVTNMEVLVCTGRASNMYENGRSAVMTYTCGEDIGRRSMLLGPHYG